MADIDMSEDRIVSIVGPIEWQHDFTVCECEIDAPENEEAFMTRACAERYYLAIREHMNRTRALLDWTRDVEANARAKGIREFTASLKKNLGL